MPFPQIQYLLSSLFGRASDPCHTDRKRNAVTGSARISRKQTEAAVKNSALSPPGDAFKFLMERVDK